MRIYTPAGDLSFKTFTFPDAQPHFRLETIDDSGFEVATVETSIKNCVELFTLGLVVDVLRQQGFRQINLDIRFLLGARMDRAIDSTQPFTLQVVSRFINSLGFAKVRILDVHSEVALRLIRNSVNILPHAIVGQVLNTLSTNVVVQPDKGAYERTRKLCPSENIIECGKMRNPTTGALSGFKVGDYPGSWESRVLIVDDICDGGGTFIGLAKELRKAGAKTVSLFVTHGIFSKGLPLEGIDKVFTTDSYLETQTDYLGNFIHSRTHKTDVVVIPVSMKELR